MGYWTYAYDALGNLKTQTDARGCVLGLGYDVLNRLTSKNSSGNCGTQVNMTYKYDQGTNGLGHRTEAKNVIDNIVSSWTYDERGRVKTETVLGFTTSYAYNSADLMTSMTYPGDNEVVTYDYNDRMLLNKVSSISGTYVSDIQYDSAGRMTHLKRGLDGVDPIMDTVYTYNAWTVQGGRLDTLVTTQTTGQLLKLQQLDYGYDNNGNITSIFDSLSGETQSFGYDALDRLTSANAVDGLANYNESYGYDAATGNLASKANIAYTYDTTHKHAVASLSNGNTYSYDANGNQTTRVIGGQTYALGYDAENRLISVTGPNGFSAAFVYDGDGRRVKSIIGGETTLFIGAHYEVTNGTATKYYFAGMQRVAMRRDGVLTYLLSDHLGSTSLTTDASGILLSETRYKAWGEVRYSSGSASTKYQFTGQYSYQSDFGLLFYNARFYDPQLGRFSSADSIVPGGVQGLDRYAYGNNSPVVYVDPSGHTSMCDESCEEEYEKPQYSLDDVLAKYGVTLKGKWDVRYKAAVVLAILAVGESLSEVSGKPSSEIFKAIYGELTFTWGSCNECKGAGGYTYSRSDIRFASMSGFNHADWLLRARNNVIHELGHAFNWALNQAPELRLANDMGFDELMLRNPDSNSYSGFASRNNERTWVQNPATTASEVFADQFLGWVMNKWQTDPGDRYGKWTAQGAARASWMTTNMAEWLYP